MALKLNLNVSKEDIQKAREENSFAYSGPTPPVDLYNAKVTKIWAGQNKDGKSVLIARLQFDNEGDKSVYNGFSILHRMSIPSDPKDQYFSIQIKSLDDFFRSISGGSLDIEGFSAAANAGKIIVEEKDKVGEPITQIGKFKVEKAQDIRIKTKAPTEYNGKEYVNVHYIDASGLTAKNDDADDVDTDDVDFDEDIDDMLGDLDD